MGGQTIKISPYDTSAYNPIAGGTCFIWAHHEGHKSLYLWLPILDVKVKSSLYKLLSSGIQTKDLVPVKLMHGAIKDDLGVTGAIVVDVTTTTTVVLGQHV